MNEADAREIIEKMRPAMIKGMMKPSGSGAYSSSTFERLLALGMIDGNFRFTELGILVRKCLEGKS